MQFSPFPCYLVPLRPSFQKLHCKIRVIYITTCSMIIHLTWMTKSNLLFSFSWSWMFVVYLFHCVKIPEQVVRWFQPKSNFKKIITKPTKCTFCFSIFSIWGRLQLWNPPPPPGACSVKWKMYVGCICTSSWLFQGVAPEFAWRHRRK
jgi:hypothetical protein